MNPEAARGKEVGRLLDILCVPREGVFALGESKRTGTKSYRGFWLRNREKLDPVLHDIFICYQRTLRRVHPWAPGGSIEATQAVREAWKTIYRLFAKRGVTL